jgi:phosphoglycolate phosphatase
MPLKLIIFDFDGTLADTFSLFLQIFDSAAEKFRFRRLEQERLAELRAMTARQILHHHAVPVWKLPSLMRYTRQSMEQRMHEISIFAGVDAMLEELSAKGVLLAALSSNSARVVEHVLTSEHVGRFCQFECGTSLFSKAVRIRRILAATGVAASEAILIGDEIRDLEAARQVGLAFGAVGWGYTALEALTLHGAEYHFHSPEGVTAALC